MSSRTIIPDFDDEEIVALLERGRDYHKRRLMDIDKELKCLGSYPVATQLLVLAKKEQTALINHDTSLIDQFRVFLQVNNDNE